MKIIISPAKKMNVNTDLIACKDMPMFLQDTQEIMTWMKGLSLEEARKLWGCNEKLAALNYRRFQEMELQKGQTPALLSYEGIQYQYMAPAVFTEEEWSYVQENVRILSGFYGVLKPLDGVTPYRLEMQAKAAVRDAKNLYEFWGNRIYRAVMDESKVVINLASKEYSKCIEHYLKPEDTCITCIFGEVKNGNVIQKGTQAKMARGEMVRFMAERGVKCPEELKEFERLEYQFKEEYSSENTYVFLKKNNKSDIKFC